MARGVREKPGARFGKAGSRTGQGVCGAAKKATLEHTSMARPAHSLQLSPRRGNPLTPLGAWTRLSVRPGWNFIETKAAPGVMLPYEYRVVLSESRANGFWSANTRESL